MPETKSNVSVELDVVYHSNEHVATPDKVVVTLTTAEVTRLKRLIALAAKENVQIRVPHRDVEFVDDEGEDVPEFQSDVKRLVVDAEGTIYLYAQHKHDCSNQIESELFTLDNLNNS